VGSIPTAPTNHLLEYLVVE